MIYDSSNLIFPSLNRLILWLADRLYVNLTRIVGILYICPPFELFKNSFANVKGSVSVNKDFLSGSCPVAYSSFRRSPTSEAQSVLRPDAGPHEICIERDARAAFTLSRYLSPCGQNRSFESRKRPRSLVTEASHFTGTIAVSKGLNTWRGVKSVICPKKFIGLCHNALHLFHGMFLSFKLVVFSFLSDLAGTLIGGIRVGCRLKGCFGDDHFPDNPGQSSCHSGSGFSLDTGSFDEPFVALSKASVEFGHLESSFTECPSERSRTGFGDLAGIFLPVGDMCSFGQAGPACNGICVFEAMKISEFGHDDETEYFTDAFGAGNDLEPVFEIFIGSDDQSDFSEYSVSLSFNGLNSFTVLPEHLSFKSVEFVPMSGHPSMHGSCINDFGSSGIDLVHLPSHDGFDFCGFFGNSVPLSAEDPQMSYFDRRYIRFWNPFGFHYLCDFCGRDFVGVSHSGPDFTEIEGIEQVDFVGDGFEHVPEPVIGAHRFDADAEWFSERLDKSKDFSGAMVWNGNFFEGVGRSIDSCIGSSGRMQVDS